MGLSSLSGRARTSARSPQAHAICDRCGYRWNFVDLQYQFEWTGAALVNRRILVCRRCLDTPQEQFRAIVLPQDPVPIINARPEYFTDYETDWFPVDPPQYDPVTGIQIQAQTFMGTVTGGPMLTPPPVGRETATGLPSLSLNAQMSPVNTDIFNVRLAVLSIISNGTTVVTVTCSKPHGLTTGQQIAVQGVTNNNAAGFFNATVISGTALNYECDFVIPSANLLEGSTIVLTTNVGIPRDNTQVPKTGM